MAEEGDGVGELCEGGADAHRRHDGDDERDEDDETVRELVDERVARLCLVYFRKGRVETAEDLERSPDQNDESDERGAGGRRTPFEFLFDDVRDGAGEPTTGDRGDASFETPAEDGYDEQEQHEHRCERDDGVVRDSRGHERHVLL